MNKNIFTLLVLSSFVSPYAVASHLGNGTQLKHKYIGKPMEDMTEQIRKELLEKDEAYNTGKAMGLTIDAGKTLYNGYYLDGKTPSVVWDTQVKKGGHLINNHGGNLAKITLEAGAQLSLLNDNIINPQHNMLEDLTTIGHESEITKITVSHSGITKANLNGHTHMDVFGTGEYRGAFLQYATANDHSLINLYQGAHTHTRTILNHHSHLIFHAGSYGGGDLILNDHSTVTLDADLPVSLHHPDISVEEMEEILAQWEDGDPANASIWLDHALLNSENSTIVIRNSLDEQDYHPMLYAAHIEHLDARGGTIKFEAPKNNIFDRLNIYNLEGNAEFVMHVDGMQGNHVNIQGTSKGEHTLHVMDSGKDLNTSSHLLELVKVSQHGADSHFSLKHGAVDLGAYIYHLDYKESEEPDSNGGYS